MFMLLVLCPADPQAGAPAGVTFAITGDIISPALSWSLYSF